MPIYPAMALLIGAAITLDGKAVRAGTRALTVLCAIAAIAAISILVAVRHVATPGDISNALSYNPSAYKLSLGHMEDLTLNSFAYLRVPLAWPLWHFLLASSAPSGRRGGMYTLALRS